LQLIGYLRMGNLESKKLKDIDQKIYMFDSTFISLCLKVFDWATFRNQKGAIKLHIALDCNGFLLPYICSRILDVNTKYDMLNI
jgi:hypothetical protein